MKSFLFGLGVGAAIGLMIAPQEGSKTRAEWMDRLRGWVKDDSEQNSEDDSDRNLKHTRAEVDQESEAVAEVLNTAKRDELLSVPGIGKATAKRIIRNRPFESEEEVLQEGVLREETLERVKEELVDKRNESAS